MRPRRTRALALLLFLLTTGALAPAAAAQDSQNPFDETQPTLEQEPSTPPPDEVDPLAEDREARRRARARRLRRERARERREREEREPARADELANTGSEAIVIGVLGGGLLLTGAGLRLASRGG